MPEFMGSLTFVGGCACEVGEIGGCGTELIPHGSGSTTR